MAHWQPDEADLLGWHPVPGDKHVCAECFGDYAVREFIEAEARAPACSYCGRSTSDGTLIAADIDDVVEFIVEGLRTEWTDPAEELPYESREGGYQGRVLDTWELMEAVELDVEGDELREDIERAILTSHWCERDYFTLGPGKALTYTWREFGQAVKHETRYLFFSSPDDKDAFRHPDDIPLSEFLDRLGGFVTDAGFIHTVTKHSFWRARVHKESQSYDTAEELGPPPTCAARHSNRMSPAGIVMFYGALDPDTAVRETFDPARRRGYVATVAKWDAVRELRVLDLSAEMIVPSLFNRERRQLRPALIFLCGLVRDISKPIVKDGQEHIEYVPTQVVTEYFRHRFRAEAGDRLHGILYPSARREGGTCCVLFCDQRHCTEAVPGDFAPAERWLVMASGSVSRGDLPPE